MSLRLQLEISLLGSCLTTVSVLLSLLITVRRLDAFERRIGEHFARLNRNQDQWFSRTEKIELLRETPRAKLQRLTPA